MRSFAFLEIYEALSLTHGNIEVAQFIDKALLMGLYPGNNSTIGQFSPISGQRLALVILVLVKILRRFASSLNNALEAIEIKSNQFAKQLLNNQFTSNQ